jgi:hypothetical protein
MDEIYIARNTYPLALSSAFFLLPCAISIPNQMHFYTAMLLLTFTLSANYWRKATYGVRRDADLVFSKLSFTIFFFKGWMVVVHGPYDSPIHYLRMCTGFYVLFSIIYFYYLSERTFHRGYSNWIYYHMMFHLFSGIEQLIILEANKIKT